MDDPENQDVFKAYFKRFRRLNDGDMKNEIIDFAKPDIFQEVVQIPPVSVDGCNDRDKSLGLMPYHTWDVYRLKSKPGLLYIKNPFLPGYQNQWIVKCLTVYPCLPNVCNIDGHTQRQGTGELWPTEDKSILKDLGRFKNSSLYKLRWVTLGYHYNWTTKLYSPLNHTPFPQDLSNLSEHILTRLGFKDFKAEAAIVNYYHMDSTLSGHTDHSERDLNAPLISMSFGQSAVFLTGGQTRQERPLAMLLNSGDIIVMSKESRLAYHAVPKVIQSNDVNGLPVCLSQSVFEAAIQDSEHDTPACALCGRSQSELLHVVSSLKELTQRKRSFDQSSAVSSSKVVAMTTEQCSSRPHPLPTTSCEGCNWILKNWDNFEFYLTHSRININIRQVGDISDGNNV